MESKIKEQLKEYRTTLEQHQKQLDFSQKQIILLQGAIQALENLESVDKVEDNKEEDVSDV